jgi:hypothetical protein
LRTGTAMRVKPDQHYQGHNDGEPIRGEPAGCHDLALHDLALHDLALHDLDLVDLALHDLALHDLDLVDADRDWGQAIGLVLDIGGQVLEFGQVLTAVVGTEQQFAT